MQRRFEMLFVVVILTARPTPAGAHRLDEYLQATRIAVGMDRVGVDIDLTPGVSIAERIVASIDTDRDGTISTGERQNYVEQVLSRVSLSVDGRPARVRVVSAAFPAFADMTAGVGVIRLHATATIPPTASGHHQLAYRNTHRPETSAYLANALVPEDPRIRIVGQRRDGAQRELTLEYEVAASLLMRTLWMGVGIAVLALLFIGRGGLRSVTTSRSESAS